MSNTIMGRIAHALAEHLAEDTDHIGPFPIDSVEAKDDSVRLVVNGESFVLPVIPV